MARDFSKNTGNYMEMAVATINGLLSGASKVAAHAWVYFDTIEAGSGNSDDIFQFIINGASTSAFHMCLNASPRKLLCITRSQTADAAQNRQSTTTITTGVWWSLGFVADIGGDTLTPYINGGADNGGAVTYGATTYTPGTATGGDAIGGVTTAARGTTRQTDGRLAELALWKLGASDSFGADEFAALYRGRLAWDVQPTNLVFYAPLWGLDTDEYDLKSQKTATITGTVARANHAPVVPFSRRWWGSTPFLGESNSIAAISSYYHMMGMR